MVFVGDKVIAEPSPGAFANVAKSLALMVEGEGADGAQSLSAKAKFELLNQIYRTLARLGARSQGVILFRDASYRLAEAYINDEISSAEFLEEYNKLVDRAASLIELELKLNPDLSDVADPPNEHIEPPDN